MYFPRFSQSIVRRFGYLRFFVAGISGSNSTMTQIGPKGRSDLRISPSHRNHIARVTPAVTARRTCQSQRKLRKNRVAMSKQFERPCFGTTSVQFNRRNGKLGLELSNATSSICRIFVPLFDEAHNPKVASSNLTPTLNRVGYSRFRFPSFSKWMEICST
jgi:hypothetical protein